MIDKDKNMQGTGDKSDQRKQPPTPRGRAGPGQERGLRGYTPKNGSPAQDPFDRRGKSPFGGVRKQATQKPNSTQLVNISRTTNQ